MFYFLTKFTETFDMYIESMLIDVIDLTNIII